MDNNSLVKKYLSTKVSYEEYSGYIVFPTNDLTIRVVAEVRAKGGIDLLLYQTFGEVNPNKAKDVKNELGKFIADAIMEKVKRDFPQINERNDISPNQIKMF